jgi:hypothetical protein
MAGAIFTLVSTVLLGLLLISGLCTFFYLGYKQLFGDDNEK